jgi:hypothetical protein
MLAAFFLSALLLFAAVPVSGNGLFATAARRALVAAAAKYFAEPGEEANWKADVTANLRVSIGLRYSWSFR